VGNPSIATHATKTSEDRVNFMDSLHCIDTTFGDRDLTGSDSLIRQRDDLLREVAELRAAANFSGGSELNALAERYYEGEGCQKPTIYLAEYERLFGPRRDRSLRSLELGVRFGASMFLWADYFPNATIVGLDIDKKPEKFPSDERVHFMSGSQDDPAALDRCMDLAGGQFDIIVDDASHIGKLSAASFAHLFPRSLKPGGFYVIEDICTAFLLDFPDAEKYAPAKVGDQVAAKRPDCGSPGPEDFPEPPCGHGGRRETDSRSCHVAIGRRKPLSIRGRKNVGFAKRSDPAEGRVRARP